MRPNRSIIKCGRLLTMAGHESESPQLVEVIDGKVATIQPLHELPATDDAEFIDLSDYVVLPGLIDAHTHLDMDILAGNEAAQAAADDATLTLRAAHNAAINVRAGITTARLPGMKNYIDVALRRAIAAGEMPGPRLVIAGRGLASSVVENVNQITVDGVDAVTAATRQNIARGVDFIKVFATGMANPSPVHSVAGYLSRREIRAAVEVADEFGLPVAAHAFGGKGLDYCVAAGVRQIEHAVAATLEQFERMASQGIFVCATLGVYLAEPGLAELPQQSRRFRDNILRAREASWKCIERARRSGVPFALGTDGIHGAIAQEAVYAARGGFSNRDALAAITVEAARLCGLQGRVGIVAPGGHADLVAVEGNPIEDLRALTAVRHVFKGGERII